MIAIPLVPTGRTVAALRSIISLPAHAYNAVGAAAVGKWLPLLVAFTTAIDGWLTVGPIAQAALLGAALLRRLTGKA